MLLFCAPFELIIFHQAVDKTNLCSVLILLLVCKSKLQEQSSVYLKLSFWIFFKQIPVVCFDLNGDG